MKEKDQTLEDFIINRFRVSFHKLPFYLNWIQKYKHFTETNDISDNIQEKFIDSLSTQYPDWQVELY